MNGPLSRDEFASLVAGGEDSFSEFKDGRASTKAIAKEMCAFSNAAGGRIFIGVDDDGRIVGAGDWSEETIMDLAQKLVQPPIIPFYQRLHWDDELDVVIAGIEQGVEKPYAYLSDRETLRYIIRVGSTSREASREELIRLTQASGAVASDLRPALGATLEDLDPKLLAARFADAKSLRFEELDEVARRTVLESAEILHPDTGGPTIYGLLCFGITPQQHLPYAVVSCVAYPGSRVEQELIDRLDADGRIEEQVEAATSFVERNLRTPSDVEGIRRVEKERPSRGSFREVVANAVCHRHYGIAGPVQLRVFEDRVEVQSPGGLPNGVTPEAMRVGVSGSPKRVPAPAHGQARHRRCRGPWHRSRLRRGR